MARAMQTRSAAKKRTWECALQCSHGVCFVHEKQNAYRPSGWPQVACMHVPRTEDALELFSHRELLTCATALCLKTPLNSHIRRVAMAGMGQLHHHCVMPATPVTSFGLREFWQGHHLPPRSPEKQRDRGVKHTGRRRFFTVYVYRKRL